MLMFMKLYAKVKRRSDNVGQATHSALHQADLEPY